MSKTCRVATSAILFAGITGRLAQAAFSTASCDNLESCSPAECTVNSETDCAFNTAVPDWSAAMSTLSCKTCTQSTAGHCNNLASTLKTGGDHVQAAWCNDEYLIIAADGRAQYDAEQTTDPKFLKGIPLPPGGDTACRVRTAASQLNVYKIPLNPQKLASGSNSVPQPLPGVAGMPAAGASAVAIDGVPIFPNYNNRGMLCWESCEVDRCNAHSGKGEDYHYHGDPFGNNCLYSEADYGASPDTAHPPLIGFSLDGFLIYGRHTRAGQEGQTVALDQCGGHEHTTFGYHYHPEIQTGVQTTSLDGTQVSGTVSYTAYKGAPMECWSGDLSQIPNFWTADERQANYDSTKSGLSSRNDLEQLKPCCGMTNYFATSGITVGSSSSGSSSSDTSSSGTDTSSSGTCDYGTCGSGNDNTGKQCPPDFGNGKPNCPQGCTAVPAIGCSSDGTSGASTPSPASQTPEPTPTPQIPNGSDPPPTTTTLSQATA